MFVVSVPVTGLGKLKYLKMHVQEKWATYEGTTETKHLEQKPSHMVNEYSPWDTKVVSTWIMRPILQAKCRFRSQGFLCLLILSNLLLCIFLFPIFLLLFSLYVFWYVLYVGHSVSNGTVSHLPACQMSFASRISDASSFSVAFFDANAENVRVCWWQGTSSSLVC